MAHQIACVVDLQQLPETMDPPTFFLKPKSDFSKY